MYSSCTTTGSLPPALGFGAGGSCGPDGRSATIDFLTDDPDTTLDQLALHVTSDDERVVRTRDLVVTGSGALRTLTVTARQPGTAVVTFTVSDGQHAVSAEMTVQLGTAHPDWVIGTDGNDLLLGAQGDDVLVGRDGEDILCGDRGTDVLIGGDGADLFSGGRGFDVALDVRRAQGDTTDGSLP